MFYLKRWTAEEDEAYLKRIAKRKKETQEFFERMREKVNPKAPPPRNGAPKVDYKKVARKAHLTNRAKKVKVTLAAVPNVGLDEE